MVFATQPARADELRPGYLELTQTGTFTWILVWKAPIKGGLATAASPSLPDDCALKQVRKDLEGLNVVSRWTVTCKRELAGRTVGLSGLDATFTDALVRVAPLNGNAQAERLTSSKPFAQIAVAPERFQVGKAYLTTGVLHILFGYDHLLFVVLLVLLLSGFWRIAKTITAFTLAHSFTLIATTVGWLNVQRAPIEALIALSIVFLAVEVVKREPGQKRLSERHPWGIAFLFGLLHGFGFAGALAEIGLPHGEVPMALLAFNLGVEIGQLAIVAATLIILALIAKFAARALRPVETALAYCIGTIASLWFIERMFA